jgi:hypothetical protein
MQGNDPDLEFLVCIFLIVAKQVWQVLPQHENISLLDDVHLVSDDTHPIGFLKIHNLNLRVIVVFAVHMGNQLLPDGVDIGGFDF